MPFHNTYEDKAYAASYARLRYPGTYYLAFRDLPDLIRPHIGGGKALDFGCGTGRSTRFLVDLGFETVGVDIAPQMIEQARALDPSGDYRLIASCELGGFAADTFDVILCAFTFDNIPTRERKVSLFAELRRLLAPEGRIINLVSSPEIYWHEWASFSTSKFPENRRARCGEIVRIIVTDLDDKRPVEDVLWPEADYRDVYAEAGLRVDRLHRPLGRREEPYAWISELTVAPWTIYLLAQEDTSGDQPARSARP
jgi:SAM-dependent methyltransferase